MVDRSRPPVHGLKMRVGDPRTGLGWVLSGHEIFRLGLVQSDQGRCQKFLGNMPVSYTHLTLPTIYSV